MLPELLWISCTILCSAASASGPSFLGENLVRQNQVQDVLEHKPAKDAECSHSVSLPCRAQMQLWIKHCRVQPTGPIEMTQCDFETVESVTDELYNNLHDLVATPFFRYYRVSVYVV